MEKTTLKDVAREAEVSVSTVSSVINESRYVAKDKKDRVLKAIEKISYHPNLIARSLKMRNSKTIGMIFPDIENTFFISLIRKAEEHAFESGYNVILCNTQNNPEKEKLYMKLLKGKMVDGFIVITSFKDKNYLEDALAGEKVVYMDRNIGVKNEVVVKLDNVRGAEEAVSYLVSLGHKRIGYINIRPDITPGTERLEGYKNGLKKAGILFDPDMVRYSGFSVGSSYKKATELLTQANRPTALFPISNRITVGALKAIKDLNLKIPKDISVIGFDDTLMADLLSPPLTVISQPAYDFGKIGIDILIKKINGIEPEKKMIKLKPKLIIRESCRKL